MITGNGLRSITYADGAEHALSLNRKIPPWLGLETLHKTRNRHEYIDDAWIVPNSGFPAKIAVKLEWTTALKLFGLRYAKQSQIPGHRLTDVGKIGQPCEPVSIDFRWMHSESLKVFLAEKLLALLL